MKKTPLYEMHLSMGAKMIDFAGYQMPVSFSGLNEEHLCVRKNLGVFDVSHMGEFWVEGSEAAKFVQRITTNDVYMLYDGKVQYSCLPNGTGGIVDDLLVYRMHDQKFLLVVNAANIKKDWDWCMSQNSFDAKLTNASDETAQLAVQGPKALRAMQKLTNEPIINMEYYTFKVLEFAGVPNVLLSTTGYTGSGGCELYFPNAVAEKIYRAVLEAGKEDGIQPIGLGARDTLRLEAGFCLYGNDINDHTSPMEAGLGWITKFTDNNMFVDRPLFEKQKTEGVSRRLKGFVMEGRGIPRQHYSICDQEGKDIGVVTSGTQSPLTNRAIGMGYLEKNYWKPGCGIFIRIRNKLVPATVYKPPFFDQELI